MLFPVSDQRARQQALEITARLDYIDIVKELASHGVTLYDTLFLQAVRGGALRVAAMPLQPRPPSAIEAVRDQLWHSTLLEALLNFHHNTGSPQATLFLKMLIARGVDIDAIVKNKETFLQSAIRQEKTVGAMAYRIGSRYQLLVARASLATLAKHGNEPIPFG